MKTLPRSTAKDVFLHLLSVGTLYVAVFSIIALLLECIDVKFPDPLDFYYTVSFDLIRQCMASLFVVWPAYILLAWLIGKDLAKTSSTHEGGIRKWLLYLTLFITSITILINLITLVSFFLNGEITTRFLLKVLVVLVVAGGVFAYYLWDLRRDPTKKTTVSRNVAWGASIAVFGSIILGFFFVGSPAQQRLMRLDDQRIDDLGRIENYVRDYYIEEGTLPKNLTDLEKISINISALTDPVTRESYTYTVKSEVAYEICATFAANSINTPDRSYYMYSYNEDWAHGIGNVCFKRTVDPDIIGEKGEINLIAPLETNMIGP
jgi:hypothetical protein